MKKMFLSKSIIFIYGFVLGGLILSSICIFFVVQTFQQDFKIYSSAKDPNQFISSCLETVVNIESADDDSNNKAKSLGSGVIIDKDGYILTNFHVANSKKYSINVYVNSSEIFPAKVMWEDEINDLAMLKINKSNLKCAKLNESQNINIGEEVFAIGNPFGFDNEKTVTSGIISGLGRKVVFEGNTMEDLIQTDAHINYGNSGGPLFNKSGQVLGLTTMKKENADGMTFCVRVDYVGSILRSIKENGNFVPPKLGLVVSNEYTVNNKVNKISSGLYIVDVLESDSNKNNKINRGNIIISINNISVNSITDLKRVLYELRTNEKIKMKIKSDNETYEDIDYILK